MAHAPEKALAEVAALPEDEQSRLGEWLLAELASERAWNERLAAGTSMLQAMAAEALAEHARGATTDLDLESK